MSVAWGGGAVVGDTAWLGALSCFGKEVHEGRHGNIPHFLHPSGSFVLQGKASGHAVSPPTTTTTTTTSPPKSTTHQSYMP
jgi:hypothetical protein